MTATSFRENRSTLTSGKARVGVLGSLGLILLLGFLVPWPIAVPATFYAAPASIASVTASEDASVAQVIAAEGVIVTAGAPLVQLRSFELERAVEESRRVVDQLVALEAEARVSGNAAEASRLGLELAATRASLAGLVDRSRTLTVRSPIHGRVITPRPEEMISERVEPGDTLLQVVGTDSVELRLSLSGGGAALVRAGNPVRLVSHTDLANTVEASVASVSTAGDGDLGAPVEARVLLPSANGIAIGATGLARVTIRRSNLFGALWWAIRTRIRGDLLL